MPEVTVTLEDVESKDVNTRRGLSTVYRLKASDGRTYTTFDDKLAKEGAKYRGQTVVLDYVESQNGDYTNYNLNGVKAGETNTGDPGIQVDLRGNDGFTHGGSADSKKETSIARAVALKAAVEVSNSTGESILSLANIYVEWLLTGINITEPAESLVQF